MNVKNATEIGGNYVGVEVKSIQDVVKAQAAGLIITDESGCRYNYWDVDEETGEEREPTEQEIFDRIAKALADGETVHACMELMDGLCVRETSITIMHTNFFIGQKVYLLRNNKIVEDEIIYISLVRGGGMDVCKLVLDGDQGHYTKANQVFATKQDLVNSLMAE
jgi:hypothetical protein